MKTFKELTEENNTYPGVLKKVPKQPQHQGSTHDQLKVLHHLANHFGLYDAADLVRSHIEQVDKKRRG
jgi:hypothetical protein